MRPTTLCFPVTASGMILLGKKRRGFGVSKWNGFGGKIEEGESFRACAVRELFEESHLEADECDLELQAFLDFQFPSQPELDHIGYVYVLHRWRGEVQRSEEMEPRWFTADALPYDDMWQGDRLWVPMIQAGRKISGTIIFAADNNSLAHTEFSDVDVLTEPEGLWTGRENRV